MADRIGTEPVCPPGQNQHRIAEAWHDYRTKVIPLEAPAVQTRECRRAFYAGANAMLTTIVGMLAPGTEPTAQDLANMDGLEAELIEFCRDILRGRV